MRTSITFEEAMTVLTGQSDYRHDTVNSVGIWPHELRPGDIIVEEYEDEKRKKRKRQIKVETVVPYACSSRGTHVNKSWCYDHSVKVRVKR